MLTFKCHSSDEGKLGGELRKGT